MVLHDVMPDTLAGPRPPASSATGAQVLERVGAPAPSARRRVPLAVRRHLLQAAVALQAEGLLRAAGAMARCGPLDLDAEVARLDLIEQEARDLVALAVTAFDAGARLPAGLDVGVGAADRLTSVQDGLLLAHDALGDVLRELLDALADPDSDGEDEPALGARRVVIARLLARHEEEACLLRAGGAGGDLPADPSPVRGRLDQFASPAWVG